MAPVMSQNGLVPAKPKQKPPPREDAYGRTRRARKHDLAVALIALVQLRKMTQAQAWLTPHPEHEHLSVQARDKRASRVFKWYNGQFGADLDFREQLARAGVGMPRLISEMEKLLGATRWCPYQGNEVPDWKVRDSAYGKLMVLLGVNAAGDHLKPGGTGARSGAASIDVGPEFESDDDWYRQAMIVEGGPRSDTFSRLTTDAPRGLDLASNQKRSSNGLHVVVNQAGRLSRQDGVRDAAAQLVGQRVDVLVVRQRDHQRLAGIDRVPVQGDLHQHVLAAPRRELRFGARGYRAEWAPVPGRFVRRRDGDRYDPVEV